MNTSILIAKLIGPILFVAAFAMLANTKELQEMAHEFLKDRGLIYVTGVMAMLGGLAIINSHNIWTADWRVIITVLGWIMTIGGAIRMALPSVVRTIGNKMLDSPTLIRGSGVLWLLAGTYITYKGYF